MKADRFFAALFSYEEERKYPWLSATFLLFLLGLGVFFWGSFFNWRYTPLNFHDWGDINIPRIDAIQDALKAEILPLHLANTSSLHDVTDRIWVLPDLISTPQMVLLYWFESETYILFDIFFNFLLGAFGLLLIRKEFKLSLFTYAVLLTVFSTNGYIQAHYGVGHFSWGGYFVFPLFFYLMLRFSSGEDGWTWVAKVVFLLFYMVLAGSEHHFFWLLIWLGSFGLMNINRFKWIFYAGLFGGLVSAVRLLPPVLGIEGFSNEFTMFFGGFPNLLDIVNQMMILTPVRLGTLNSLSMAGVWEYDIYFGLIGTLFILYFGLFEWLKSTLYRDFFLPSFLILFFSLGKVYSPLFNSHFPFLGAERVPTRMVIVPIVVLILMAAIFFQKWLDQRNFSGREFLLFLLPLSFLLHDLYQHYQLWNVRELAKFFDPIQINVVGNNLSNHPDSIYTNTLIVGIIISSCSAGFLLSQLWAEQKKKTVGQ